MVEKAKPAAGIENKDGPSKRSGILKKTTSPSLETVPEFVQSTIERTDSSLDIIDSERNSTPPEEQGKFKSLCEGVQNCLALFQTSLTELLCLKDELLKHALPPSLLLKIVLVTGKLFRSSSDLSVPITELVRMVKLYSTPWETKSAALKKLHEDYENKQRQLNVALQKLVLVGIQSERLAQERKVLNWEKLFSKVMTSRAHGYRWKFLIESFKEKVKTGEVYVAGSSTDEEAERERRKSERELEFLKKRNMKKDTAAKRIMRESVSGGNSIPQASVAMEKRKDDVFDDEHLSDVESTSAAVKRSARPGIGNLGSDRTSALRPKTPVEEKPKPKNASRPRINFLGASDSNESEEERKPAVKFTEYPSEPKHVTLFDDNTEASEPKVSKVKGVIFDEQKKLFAEHKESKPPAVVPSPVVKADKECWTHEPEYDSFLHLRMYRPECKKVDAPFCSVAFNGHLLKTEIFENEEPEEEIDVESASQGPNVQSDPKKTEQGRVEKQRAGAGTKASPIDISGKTNNKTATSRGTTSRASNASPPSRPVSGNLAKETKFSSFKEVVFKLPNGNGSVLGKPPGHISNEPLRFAVHPGKDRPMIAMSSVNYGDLKIMDQFEGQWSHAEKSDVSLQHLPLTSVVSERDMPFNSPCGHISVVSYLSSVERPKTLCKSTETLPFDDLVDALIETRKMVEAGDKKDEVREPMYSEGDVKALREQHAEEMNLLQEEYEMRLNELAQGLYPPGVESPLGYIDAATSPMYARSPSLSRSPSPDHAKGNRATSRSPSPRKPRPKIPNLPDWGKDLPDDFLVRLDLFAENSNKYRHELGEKTRRAIKEKYELQMAVQNRLSAMDEERSEEIDVCLPAVFMPTRSGHVFSPKAHSYFHPTGSSKGRLTQPPSIFKLPSVSADRQISVLNLFEMAQKHTSTAPSWPRKEQTRAQTIVNPELSQTAPPPPTAFDVWSPPPDIGRARTR